MKPTLMTPPLRLQAIRNRLSALLQRRVTPMAPASVNEKEGWFINSLQNQFFRQQKPVTVLLKDGSEKILKCPSCSRMMNQFVTHWKHHV